jgi:hypothetical protein
MLLCVAKGDQRTVHTKRLRRFLPSAFDNYPLRQEVCFNAIITGDNQNVYEVYRKEVVEAMIRNAYASKDKKETERITNSR